MSVIVHNIFDKYNYVFYEQNDHRTRHIWPSSTTLVVILLSYLIFIKMIGPAWMKDRQPYQFKKTLLVYNAFQVVASGYLFYEGFFKVWLPLYNWTCEPVDYSDSPSAKKAQNLIWMYFLLKLIDLLDTVFFVLRKKNRQITGLHLYHHSMMPICAWVGLKFYPGGHSTLLGVINCFVHMIMYTYYMIAGLGPEYQKYLWWKRHVTTLQLIQFLIVLVHNAYPLFSDCNYPKWIHLCLSICSIHFIFMFGNFYYVNYIKNPSKKKV